MADVVKIIEDRLKSLQMKADDITLPKKERYEAVFEMSTIKKTAKINFRKTKK